MKDHGRVAVCGSISTYNNPEVKGHYFFETIITKRLKLQGFIGAEYQADWPAATTQVAKWIVEGKVNHKEHVTDGFDQTPQALIGVLTGKNTGKAIVKI
ncbi:NADP-dependent alkenal double bond reductase P2-like [Branchiostoma floridae]|nr:NADP-dependent alkenal double bond reductase P2-like [Branchiostoma floridae]